MAADVRALLERAQGGDRQAFGELVRLHEHRAYLVAYRMTGNHHDATDVTQDAFVRAYRAIGSFDRRSSFFTWLYRIVVNVAINHRRSARRRPTVSAEQVQLPAALAARAGEDPARALELKRMVAEVQGALDELSDGLRAALVLVLFEGMAYREAAEILGCSEGTVGWRVHEARKRLGQRLEQYLDRAGPDAGARETGTG